MSSHGEMTTYTVHAKRWKRGWELHIDGLGVTQSRTLNDAEAMVRDYITLDTGADPNSFSVEILPEVDRVLDAETRAARQATRQADKAARDAASLSRTVARKLSNKGLSGREIAVVMDVSPQRVSQLLRPKPGGAESLKVIVGKTAATAHGTRTRGSGSAVRRKRGLPAAA